MVDDFGFTLNPLLLAGQVHGGIAQGAGQALMERAIFDEHGQLLTASLMDYCLPRADNLPSFDFETRNVPSTINPMGLKGAGEAGSIGSTPAVMNAIADALWRAYRRRAHRHARDPVCGLPRDQRGAPDARDRLKQGHHRGRTRNDPRGQVPEQPRMPGSEKEP